MVGFSPRGGTGEGEVWNLLALISNPDAFRDRMIEHAAARDAADTALIAAAEAKRDLEARSAELDAREKALAEAEATNVTKAEENAAKAADLAAQQSALLDRESEQVKREDAYNARCATLDEREKNLEAFIIQTNQTMVQAKAMQDEAAGTMARLQTLFKGPSTPSDVPLPITADPVTSENPVTAETVTAPTQP